MANFNFNELLTPYDFEELARDILEKYLNLEFESFGRGKDGGVDLRHKGNNLTIIAQVKTYKNFNDLKKTLINSEFNKVVILNPSKYYLIISLELTKTQKDALFRIFEDYMETPANILHKKDLNRLLDKKEYLDILYSHIKLWLPSSKILEPILNNLLNSDIKNYSEFEYEKVKKEIGFYVKNPSLSDSLDILRKHHSLIISGEPGIGKTTLARILIYLYLEKGYTLVKISSDINEAFNVDLKNKKIIFYYDDFLGTNFLKVLLAKNEEKKLVDFIEFINRQNSNHKLILTTREYILKQAEQEYPNFLALKGQIAKYILDLKSYSRFIKAKIFYNHIHYFKIPNEYIKEILKNHNYIKIIDHKNYNPRIIEYMTKLLPKDIIPQEYFSKFIQNLNNPENVWKEAFNKITKVSQYILFSLWQCGNNIGIEDLKMAVKKLIENEGNLAILTDDRDCFEKSIEELEDTFIRVDYDRHSKYNTISFKSPSVIDFITFYVKTKPDLVKSMIKSSVFIEQLYHNFTTLKNVSGKIYLTDDLRLLLEPLILKKFNKILSKGEIWAEYNDGRYLLAKDNSRLKKILVISKAFNLQEFSKLSRFIWNLIKNIDLTKLKNKNDYIDIVIATKHVYNFDIDKILEYYVNIRNINEYEDLLNIVNLAKTFGQKFDKHYKRIDSKIFYNKLEEILWPYVECGDYEDSVIYRDEIEDIGFILSLDLRKYIDFLEEFIGKYESHMEDMADDMRLSGLESRGGNSFKNIAELFQSLGKGDDS